MKHQPSALRLVRASAASSDPPRAPFGLAGFDPSAASVAVEVDRDEAVPALLARLPRVSELAAGAVIVVLGGGGRGLFAKVLGTSPPLPRAIRATALLARGYRDIEAWVDDTTGDDLVIGVA